MKNLLSIRKNHMYVGRCATAIYLILKTELPPNSKILYPANICYAAVYPSIYAGCEPVFCDIDLHSGNIDPNSFYAHLDGVQATVIPHMYGNPIRSIDNIATICNEKGVLLIEDCASAMGADIDGVLCGSFGDYAVFSTGYAKTLDIGRGGIIFSDRHLDAIRDLYLKLPEYTIEASENDIFFSKLYRLIRNNPRQTLDRYIWKSIGDGLERSYLYKDESVVQPIEEALDTLSDIIDRRRSDMGVYSLYLRNNSNIEMYSWNEGSVPWRYNILVEPEKKRDLIDHLLGKGLPVSDWYPDVSSLFGMRSYCWNAMEFGRRILNFPLLISTDKIKEICFGITEFYGK